MNDERIMETMMDALPDLPTPGPNYTQGFVKHLAVRDQLAALRAAGFDVYRPDDCEKVHNFPSGFAYHDPSIPLGTYRLVPVGGEGRWLPASKS